MARSIEIGVLLIALVVFLDWAEIGLLKKRNLHLRIGVLLMLAAGQLLLAGTAVGGGIRWCLATAGHFLGWAIASLLNWLLALIPQSGQVKAGKLPADTADQVGTAIVVIVACWIVLKVILGAMPDKVSEKELDWKGVYLAALIPALIFSLPNFSKDAAQNLNDTVTTAIYNQMNQAV